MAAETAVMDRQEPGIVAENAPDSGGVAVVFQREVPAFFTDPYLTASGLGRAIAANAEFLAVRELSAAGGTAGTETDGGISYSGGLGAAIGFVSQGER